MINNIIISSICIIVEFTIIEKVPVINAAVCMTAIMDILYTHRLFNCCTNAMRYIYQ